MTPQYYLAELASAQETEVLVNRRDFEAALQELVPSVSQQEMEHYQQVRRKFEDPEASKAPQEPEPGRAEEEVSRMLQALGSVDVQNGSALSLSAPESSTHLDLNSRHSVKANGNSKNKGKGKARAQD